MKFSLFARLRGDDKATLVSEHARKSEAMVAMNECAQSLEALNGLTKRTGWTADLYPQIRMLSRTTGLVECELWIVDE